MRQNGALSYLHGDHLGSTSVTTNNTGVKTNDVRYYAYGSQRGTGSIFALPTDHTFTGQKLDRGTGLMYYGARYYDGALGMFISPDTLVPQPGDPQSLNRYSYVLNNPVRYTDPTGHNATCAGFAANPLAYAGCTIVTDGPQALQQIESLVVQYGPQVTQLLQQAGDKLPALVDKAGQLVNGSQLTASQASNTSGHGQPNDPNQEPWLRRELTQPEVQQFTKASTHLGTNKVTVLGHFKPPSGPNYIEAAKAQGATYFDMPANFRQGLTSANQWELNKQFLREAIARGDKIIVGTKIDYQNVDSWLFREISFLKDEYNLILQDSVFVPVP